MEPPVHAPDSGAARGARASLAPDIVRTTREYVDRHLQPLRESAARGEAGVAHARAVAAVFDGLLSAYFLGAWSCVRNRIGIEQPVSLLAVGGFGRSVLGLGSDLDLLVLANDTSDPRVRELAEVFLYPLWDAGVSVGHAVRSPDEMLTLAREDLRTATTLLDARVLAGDAALGAELIDRGRASIFDGRVNEFLDSLAGEMSERHGRHGASVYLLEPNLKLGRGALRDLDIAQWALAARYRTADFGDALRAGAIATHDAEVLESAREFYWRARGVLHARAGRRSDRLTFDEQESCARAFGFVDAGAEDEFAALAAGSEQFMQSYYRHARAVATTVDRLLERCRSAAFRPLDRAPRSDRIADGIERFDGALTFAEHHALRDRPVQALRIVELALRQGLPLAARAREMIADCASDGAWCEALRSDPASGPAFIRLLSHGGSTALRARGVPVSSAEPGRASVLAELHDLGLLLALVPEFHPVTGRVHHDTYHVYTVDVHSVAAVDRLHQIAGGEHADTFALAARVLAEIERRHVVIVATLLHDVGKGRGGDHSKIGAQLARDIAARLGLAASECDDVAWLVGEHLTLYHVATRRDLSDPATLASLSERMQDVWRLRALFLVTVADLSTTSPTSMTSWKARMLDELLRCGEEVLAARDVRDSRDDIRRQLSPEVPAADRAAVDRFLERVPQRYLLGTPASSVARHARAVALHADGRPLVHIASLDASDGADLLEIVVLAPDRPGLLARLTAMLFRARLDVHAAQLYPFVGDRSDRGVPWAFDVFTVRRLDDDPGALTRLALRLPRDLAEILSSPSLPEQLEDDSERRRPVRSSPAIRTEVVVDNLASDKQTVIEVYGRDRPGFLYAVARGLYDLGLTITLSKVNTEGHRAADVFYVTETDGGKVDAARFEAIRERLRDAVRPPES